MYGKLEKLKEVLLAKLHPSNMVNTILRPTMVDKIPWDTCVIALIFGVFKMEF